MRQYIGLHKQEKNVVLYLLMCWIKSLMMSYKDSHKYKETTNKWTKNNNHYDDKQSNVCITHTNVRIYYNELLWTKKESRDGHAK